MSVESVNNSKNNAGLWAVGAAVVGAAAGTGVAYLTRPFLKDGAPTDSFVKKSWENIEKILKEEEKVEFAIDKEFYSFVEKSSTKEELLESIKNSSLLKQHNAVDSALADANNYEFSFLKQNAVARKQFFSLAVAACYDKGTKKLVKPDGEPGNYFNAVKKAARSIQGKYALIYGSIAAAVLGISTYLVANGRKSCK